MSFKTRRLDADAVYALVAAHNKGQEEAVASFFHADVTSITDRNDYRAPTVTPLAVTAAAPTDLATRVALANDIKSVILIHLADSLAHDTALSAVLATADATDEATAITLANAEKAAINTHYTEANVHFTNDATNTIAAVDATDTASLDTLLNELKPDINAHILSAPAGAMIELVDA
jgi:hypothetical protein